MAEAKRLVRVAGVAVAVLALGGGVATQASAGTVHPDIVGGQPTTIQENPFMVTVEISGAFCGGSIVAPNKVLTAAHCSEGAQASDFTVTAGRTSLQEAGEVAKVTNVWVDPDFNSGTMENDASVLTLDKSLTEAPIAIASSSDTGFYQEGTNATVYGWGTTSENGELSDDLQQVDVPITSDATCTSAYQDRYLKTTQVCAGVPEGGKDSCQGDSGGPLVAAAADGTRKEIGIVSWGDGCARANTPGVYSRVTALSDVIQQQINS